MIAEVMVLVRHDSLWKFILSRSFLSHSKRAKYFTPHRHVRSGAVFTRKANQTCVQIFTDLPSKGRRLTFLLSSDQVFTRWRVLCPPSHAEASKAILFELLNRVRRIKSWYSGRFQKLTAFTSSHDRRKFLPGDRQSSLSFHRWCIPNVQIFM